jgi:acyl-CoA thioester hydrolase
MNAQHRFHQRIYTQHTDVWGIVYYANYFVFAEYARAEWFRTLGMPISKLTAQEQGYFVVARANAHFKAPAFLDDALYIETKVQKLKRLSVDLSQMVYHESRGLLADLVITIAWLAQNGRPSPLPQPLTERLTA